MPSPRLLGLPGPLHFLDQRDRPYRDEDESAAWGVSPIETYFKGKLNPPGDSHLSYRPPYK